MSNGIELTVKAVATHKGSTEQAFERRVAKILKDLGLYSRHNSDTAEVGIPDRYVVGGNWIECKVMDISGKRKVNPLRLFSVEQKNYLTALHKAGDRAWVAIQFQGKIDPIVVFMPWVKFRDHGQWTMEDLMDFGWKQHGRRPVDLKYGIGNIFGRNMSSYSDGWFYEQS